ncbi:VOC family protein [Adhaeribacter rhizoryzae]|uniref:VOC family protein n=1 Tax=Adhaeribacter rhizoryzae TaxID=2607907 RepID=A0A5M6DK86_9BACT|nr:VOC family protein [Adhaeribacter rhizoryzae]KAA5546692.1 VOC family protein [Adhaeribacter rhizoryzae]
MEVQPYLTFRGNCEEAFNFYKEALSGEIPMLSYFESAPMDVPEAYKKKILHAILKLGQAIIMASDSLPDHPVTIGNNVTLSLNFENIAQLETAFTNLSAGGQVTMPLQDTFWGAQFGMLTDKFGINWMFNCEQKK